MVRGKNPINPIQDRSRIENTRSWHNWWDRVGMVNTGGNGKYRRMRAEMVNTADII